MAIRVNPTRMELTRLKRRLKTAVRGHKLLKDKRDEMVRQFIIFIRRNHQIRLQVEQALMQAMNKFSYAKSAMGSASVMEALFYPARQAAFDVAKRNVMSVDVPKITYIEKEEKIDLPYGFVYTSSELDSSVMDLAALLPLLVELAEVEKTCNLLASEIEKTRRRVNALEYVMIPQMQSTIKFISMKLEENDRASLVRLMKAKEIIMQA